MQDCKPAATPVNQSTALLPNEGEHVDKEQYQELITPCNSVEDMRPIALTSVLGKLQGLFVVKWFCKISSSQYGSLAVLALVKLLHNWHQSMDENQRLIRIMFLDFREAFDLIDHNKLLENIGAVRPALIKWLAVFLKDRSHHTRVGEEESVFSKSMEVCHKEVELGQWPLY